jgi:hypothetical protein
MSIYIRVFITALLGISCMPWLYGQQKDSLLCTQHSCCSGNDPTPAGIMISRLHAKGEWMFSYKYMHMSMKGLRNGTRSVSEKEVFSDYLMAPENMEMNMHMLMAMYGATNRLTLMTMLHYNSSSMHMNMFSASSHHHTGAAETGSDHNMQSAGFGDIKLYAMYGILNTSRHQILMSGGLSFPTGNIDIKGSQNNMMYPGSRMPYSMQLGSGTIDLLPCINYLYQYHDLTFSSQVSAIIRTGKNDIGYAYGNAGTLSSWMAYKWLPFVSSSIRLEGVLSGEISGRDKEQYLFNEPSANPANYGGKMLTGYIGSLFRLPKGALSAASISMEYGVPLYQYVNNIQMKQRQALFVSVQYGF